MTTQSGISPWDFGLDATWEDKDSNLLGLIFSDRGLYRPGDTVQLVVAKAEDLMKEIPKLKNMSCRKAKKEVVKAGFTVGKVKWRARDAPPYVVLSQSPEAGKKAKPGSPIDITCNRDDDD